MYIRNIRPLALIILGCAALHVAASINTEHVQPANAARYDNYRLYRLHLENDQQVRKFQELEEVSDSVVFYGHARHPAQNLTILVSAHKIADITELLKRYRVDHKILVKATDHY